ncbi:hypothetical protein GCM10027266_09260 [Arenimonas alkanexedens]
MFGHPWVSQYGAAPDGVAGDTWAAVLAGLTPHQVAAGLRAVSLVPSDWPPTAPRFRSLCLGIPTLPQVRIELRAGNPEPSPFARLIWQYLDGYAYRRADADKADRMLRDAYELAAAFVMAGVELPGAALAIAKEAEAERTPASPEVARRALDEIAERLGVDRKTEAAGPDA